MTINVFMRIVIFYKGVFCLTIIFNSSYTSYYISKLLSTVDIYYSMDVQHYFVRK